MVNLVMVVFSASFLVYTNGQDIGNSINMGHLITAAQEEMNAGVLDIMQNHFNKSLNYLYTGVQFGSQYGERPGLAKKLRGMSDAEWEAGMAALNKYLEHSGSTDMKFFNKLTFNGGETADLSISPKGQTYADSLKTMLYDSKAKLDQFNNLYYKSINYKDGDIAHYLEEKIEKEVEHSHELKGHMKTLEPMKGIGAAVAAFDSNL